MGIVFVWIVFILFKQKTLNVNRIKRYENKKYFCNIVIPLEDTNILQLTQCYKSNKALLTIYSNLEYLVENISGCKSNLW